MKTKQEEYLTSLVEDYKAARLVRDEKRMEYESADIKLKRTVTLLIDHMNEHGLKSTPREESGFMITKVRRPSISSTAENREQIREWLIETYGDDVDFVEETINKKALTEKIIEEIEKAEKNEDDYPQFLNVRTHPHVHVTGWKQWKESVRAQ